jgi:hypothetical protein
LLHVITVQTVMKTRPVDSEAQITVQWNLCKRVTGSAVR